MPPEFNETTVAQAAAPVEQHDQHAQKISQAESKKAAAGGASKPESSSPWWVNGAFVILVHIVGVLSLLFYHPADWRVAFLAVLIWYPSTLGITAGYHRLWSHRAYSATTPLRIFLAILGTLGFQGSIKWWVLRHRIHHRFTDTEDDPYTIKKGFFFAHMGWIFEKPVYRKMKLIDASDLNADWVVTFQHKYYVPLALVFGFGLPTLLGAALGDPLGGLLYGGFVTRLMIWHCTFCINSVAHWIGEREFASNITAGGGLLVSLLTNGEGYHNFHHAYPKDFRNGVKWYDFDPTKWFINVWWAMGLAYDLVKADGQEIEKSRIQVIEEKLEEKKRTLDWGPKEEDLPVIQLSEFLEKFKQGGSEQIILDGYVVEMREFKSRHPGGEKILKAFYGKDASKAFHGELNFHTSAAINLSKMYRVARLEGKKDA